VDLRNFVISTNITVVFEIYIREHEFPQPYILGTNVLYFYEVQDFHNFLPLHESLQLLQLNTIVDWCHRYEVLRFSYKVHNFQKVLF